MQRLNQKTIVPALLTVLCVVFIVALGLLWHQEQRLDSRFKVEDRNMLGLQAQLDTLNSAASFAHVTPSVSDNAVYLPDVRLKLPLNDTTLQLLYSPRTMGSAQKATTAVIDVSTTAEASYPQQPLQRLACIPVRLAFEAKSNPYNPHEKNVGSVTLADGRTLQIYAFHEPSCDLAFHVTNTDTDALGALFKQARSY